MAPIISRFAPAPTGYLHLGHVVNALCVWGMSRARGRSTGSGQASRVLLRIEDHDRLRSRPEYEAALLEDLAWLGFVPDGPPVRQSERSDIYVQALDGLRRRGLVYACGCSRAEIEEQTSRPGPSGPGDQAGPKGPALRGELRYPGTCRDRGLAEAAGLGLRVRLDRSVERFTDLRHGLVEQTPADQCGDLLARDRDGHWTYQFAVTVDDYLQGVTLVIRGDDLLFSTGRQLQLARLLGRTEPPEFYHHRLIMKSPGQKLSKSDRDTGVRDLRAQGWSAARVIGRAAALAGFVDRETPLLADEAPRLFAYHPKP